jgi:glycosyltransferase involved in cell wall biosynthesis
VTYRLAFVIPWYGDGIPGGAESCCRSTVRALQKAGASVEVLTTCVKEFRSDWNHDFHPEGVTVESGVTVRRFKVRQRDTVRFDAVNYKLMHNQALTSEEEQTYVTEMINSPGLCDFILTHQADYVFLFIPYMFGTTYHGVLTCPARSVIVPCLHNESYARMQVLRPMFQRARGVLFNSNAEKRLADELFALDPARTAVVGAPVDCTFTFNPARFRHKYGVSDFFLYAGRTEKGKGADLLVEYYGRYIDEMQRPEQLVFIGGCDIAIPERHRTRIVELGFVPVQDKYDAFGAAIALCVPSLMESFSIVTMESWLAYRPVIVNEACPVTREFCNESNGGLYFANYEEFSEILRLLSTNTALAEALGSQGRQYVLDNFHPDVVAARYLSALTQWGFGSLQVAQEN